METDYSKDKMAAGAFGRARNRGSDGPFTSLTFLCRASSHKETLISSNKLIVTLYEGFRHRSLHQLVEPQFSQVTVAFMIIKVLVLVCSINVQLETIVTLFLYFISSLSMVLLALLAHQALRDPPEHRLPKQQ